MKSTDEKLIHRAIELARRGIGLASPNPYVGAVIADAQGNIVGEGAYTYAGIKHAEILALEAAGAKARGGTIYINLEPHAHQGRTPPCTDVLIAAGIGRVVASMPDPNPKVRGRGFTQLRSAGVAVEVGALEGEARKLNEAFARYIRDGAPFVTLKSAMTLDGKIAPHRESERNADTATGFSGTWITGQLARAHVHELRHQHDAILTGIGTVLADNPLLTDRSGRPRRRPLLRVILDSDLRLPVESRIMQSSASEHKDDVLVFCISSHAQKKSQLEQLGIRVEVLPKAASSNHPDLCAVLRRLAQLEITSLMIEGGSTINASALAANLVDKVFLYYASKMFGSDAISFADASALSRANQPLHIKNVQLHRFDNDFAIEGCLRDPYAD
jgi:diaminohydroxyphosphoribosylaminopyrimidine deaminase / 5-amino-6-(5-phosphoribosylamino)uracil reductase